MKKGIFLVCVCAGLAGWTATAQPDPAAVATAIAEREAAEERFRRLSADIESLMASNDALQRRLSQMSDEIRRLRESQARLSQNTDLQEDLRRLAQAIEEVDRKRQADRKLILDQMGRIEKLIAAAPATGSRSTPAPAPPVREPGPVAGYEYEVQRGDTVSSILEAYNAEFRSRGMRTVTLTEFKAANPGLNPDRIQVGQKVIIPEPRP